MGVPNTAWVFDTLIDCVRPGKASSRVGKRVGFPNCIGSLSCDLAHQKSATREVRVCKFYLTEDNHPVPEVVSQLQPQLRQELQFQDEYFGAALQAFLRGLTMQDVATLILHQQGLEKIESTKWYG